MKHPKLDLSYLTARLSLTPDICRLAGAVRTSPTGKPMPGLNKYSVWSYTREFKNERAFFRSICKFIDELRPRKSVFLKVASNGGSSELIVELPGDINLGDSISWKSLKQLSAFHISLGVEVFPKFGDRTD